MAQTRFFEFKADDKTWDLNRHLLGLVEPGVYRGFGHEPLPSMVLRLTPTAGGANPGRGYTNATPPVPYIFSMWLSLQGVIVWEDDNIELPITATGGTGRVDIVVASHTYISSAGGTAAVYSIVEGVPGATPTAPATPAGYVRIGKLTLPASCTTLNQAGVSWQLARIPNFAQKPNPAIESPTGTVNVSTDNDKYFIDAATKFLGVVSVTGNTLNNYLINPLIGTGNVFATILETGSYAVHLDFGGFLVHLFFTVSNSLKIGGGIASHVVAQHNRSPGRSEMIYFGTAVGTTPTSWRLAGPIRGSIQAEAGHFGSMDYVLHPDGVLTMYAQIFMSGTLLKGDIFLRVPLRTYDYIISPKFVAFDGKQPILVNTSILSSELNFSFSILNNVADFQNKNVIFSGSILLLKNSLLQ